MEQNAVRRPDNILVDRLEETLEEITRAEAEIDALRVRIATLKQEVTERALDLVSITDRHERVKAVRYLYWTRHSVNSFALCAALLEFPENKRPAAKDAHVLYKKWGPRLRQMIGPIGLRKCSSDDCDSMVPIESKAELTGQRPRHYCELCVSRQRADAFERRDQDDQHIIEMGRKINERRKEFESLKAASALSEDQLARLYELSWSFAQQW